MTRQRQDDDRRKGMQKGRRLTVEVNFTPAPDAQARLRRSLDVILRAAARAEESTMQEAGEASEEPDDRH